MNILVVDDEPDYRLLMKAFLMAEGWDVFLAEDGEKALDKMSRTRMDIIISDVYMPVMDGVKFHRTVRGMPGYENIPFLFVSGYDDQLTLEAVKNPRIEGFLKKGRPPGILKEWVIYLTTPEESRPRIPPGGTKFGSGRSGTPIL
jgi:CheY-like chemotaxis protein